MENIDKETELLKEYMLYYVDILAHNAMVKIRYSILKSNVWDGIAMLSKTDITSVEIMDFEMWKSIDAWGQGNFSAVCRYISDIKTLSKP